MKPIKRLVEEMVINIKEITKAINVLLLTEQVKGEMAERLKNLQEYHNETESSVLNIATNTEVIKFAADKYESILRKFFKKKHLKA